MIYKNCYQDADFINGKGVEKNCIEKHKENVELIKSEIFE